MKKTKKWQIILIVVLAMIIYLLPIVSIFVISYFEEKAKTFEVKDNIVEIAKGKLMIEKVESFYDEEDETYYITGYLKNKTENEYSFLDISYRLYDKEGNVLGEATAYLDNLSSKKTWKFKATYSEIDANEVDHFEFLGIDYY